MITYVENSFIYKLKLFPPTFLFNLKLLNPTEQVSLNAFFQELRSKIQASRSVQQPE